MLIQDELRAAVRRAVTGTSADAVHAGRMLLAITPALDESARLEVEAVLRTADPRFWIALERVRARLFWDPPKPSMERPQGPGDPVPRLCVRALFADGRIREQAVRLLAASGSTAALPVLGLRAADWAGPVRAAARTAIARHLDGDADGSALAAVAPMALHLARRQEGRWLAERVDGALTGPGATRTLAALLASPDAKLRRAAYQSLAGSGGLSLARAVQAALGDPDNIIRRRCAEAAKRQATDVADAWLLERMLGSHTPLVRVEALDGLHRLGERTEIHKALADRSSLVRATARFHLRPFGVDFAETYRNLISEPSTLTAAAVAGLAEVGSAEDADMFLRPLLHHSGARIRAEAIRGLNRLAAKIEVDEILPLIEQDQSAAVVKAAVEVLLARGAGVAPERLLDLLDSARPVRVRLAARRLLAARDTTWRLAVDVMLLADPEYAVAARARSDLDGALREQVYQKPSGQAAALLTAHLPTAERLLEPRTADLLRFTLGLPRSGEADREGLQPVHQARATVAQFLRRVLGQ